MISYLICLYNSWIYKVNETFSPVVNSIEMAGHSAQACHQTWCRAWSGQALSQAPGPQGLHQDHDHSAQSNQVSPDATGLKGKVTLDLALYAVFPLILGYKDIMSTSDASHGQRVVIYGTTELDELAYLSLREDECRLCGIH